MGTTGVRTSALKGLEQPAWFEVATWPGTQIEEAAIQSGTYSVSGDDKDAAGRVAALLEQLGFAPIKLGNLAQGGLLVQARGNLGPLVFQDLIKFENK